MNTPAITDDRLSAMLRQYEVERFYTREAALLDAHQYEEWVELFTDDATYFMPIRRTRLQKEIDQEFTKPGEMAFFNDDKGILRGRVAKLRTGRSWSEDPRSRTRRLITNVDILDDDGSAVTVSSNFLLYRTRLNSEEDTWIGSRRDTLRRVGEPGSFQISARTIFLEQTLLLARNLSNFF
jgi:biphenyl 2,3-dioxygenase subunit beta